MTFLFWCAVGVLQGCPGSAFLFNIALDPCLAMFKELLENVPSKPSRGIVRACADDLGVALRQLRMLTPFFHLLTQLKNSGAEVEAN